MNIKHILFYSFGLILLTTGCDSKEDEAGDLEINMNLLYKGEPLVMFQDYTFPGDKTINFSRFSMYLSDVTLDDAVISDVSFHNLTDSHVDLSEAEDGYVWNITDIPTGNYNSLNFGVGVNKTENAKDPGTFESGHPLAKPAEHWFSWASFIFMKVEANVDTNGDGNKDLPLALHLGDDDAYRTITLAKPSNINSETKETLTLEIDIFDLLGGDGNTYNIEENPQIHSLGQKEAVVELANNINSAFK